MFVRIQIRVSSAPGGKRGTFYSFKREFSAEMVSAATPQQGAVRMRQALACLLQAQATQGVNGFGPKSSVAVFS